ncbi:unnamed protein product [Heligmosomoides polygyrus]|uniref:Transposase n=1 Tax=Heligmosomoides polygyrus TaxID=6339 RepID=A0A183FGM1_HELPZ|nr:unnamed protein product [Heligmosomoides polygyrus]
MPSKPQKRTLIILALMPPGGRKVADHASAVIFALTIGPWGALQLTNRRGAVFFYGAEQSKDSESDEVAGGAAGR